MWNFTNIRRGDVVAGEKDGVICGAEEFAKDDHCGNLKEALKNKKCTE